MFKFASVSLLLMAIQWHSIAHAEEESEPVFRISFSKITKVVYFNSMPTQLDASIIGVFNGKRKLEMYRDLNKFPLKNQCVKIAFLAQTLNRGMTIVKTGQLEQAAETTECYLD